MAMKKESRLRGRFKQEIDDTVMRYVASLPFDWRLYKYDIRGSLAHAEMLEKQGIISAADYKKIKTGLDSILVEIEKEQFQFKIELEDIHMNIESRLFEKIGEAAGRLHTARSRNDQIAMDMRLYTRDAVSMSIVALIKLNGALLRKAEKNVSVIMPGYTHLQQAQPILFAHYLLAYFEMFNRDIARLEDCLKRINVSPLGSGALAGVPYQIDRAMVARKLAFVSVCDNSIDGVSDRDFVIEYEAAAALIMTHLSRLAEEMVMWSTREFGFIEIGDAFSTSSSIMPQKKNPDVAELARGKSGRVFGNLMAMLTVMKGLPLSYNRDLQEDKEGLFDTVDTLLPSLDVMSGLIDSIKINADKMKDGIGSLILATDIADYLVGKGLTFRDAHHVVSQIVNYAIVCGRDLDKLGLEEYRKFSPAFEKDVASVSLKGSVDARISAGGTATSQVKKQLKKARALIDKYEAKKD